MDAVFGDREMAKVTSEQKCQIEERMKKMVWRLTSLEGGEPTRTTEYATLSDLYEVARGG